MEQELLGFEKHSFRGPQMSYMKTSQQMQFSIILTKDRIYSLWQSSYFFLLLWARSSRPVIEMCNSYLLLKANTKYTYHDKTNSSSIQINSRKLRFSDNFQNAKVSLFIGYTL